MKTMFKFAAATLLTASCAGTVSAHVSFANAPVSPGSTVAAVLQLPHGCEGKATTEVRVKLPEGFINAKPMPKAGWELEVIKGDYQKSYEEHGKTVTSGPIEIRWKSGNLSDDYFDTFTIRGTVSGVEGDAALAFPTTQICGADATEIWDEVGTDGADPHALKNPAPVLKIAAGDAAMAGHDHAAMADMPGMGNMDTKPAAAGGPVKVGDIDVSDAYVKAMLPGQPVGGGFLTLHNGGASDDRLLSIVSPVAGRVEMHEMVMQNDVMRMRQLNDGIAIPAGETVTLKPGALHLMFMDVKQPFVAGTKVGATLTFEKAGAIAIELPVQAAR